MMEAVIGLKIPKNWMTEISEKCDARVRIIERKPYADYGSQDLVEIDAEDMKEVLESIQRNPLVSKVEISSLEKGRALAAVSTQECLPCHVLITSGCFLVTATTKEDGRTEWTLIASRKESFKDLIGKLEKSGCEVKLESLKRISRREILTDRQEEILLIAFQKGYFDYPKRISIRQLARICNVSISTMSEILRKGQKKLMKTYF